jgi:hypothetical protein
MTGPTTAGAPAAPGVRELDDETIVNPDREVTLVDGTKLIISPWGARRGKIVLDRLQALQPALAAQGGTWNANELIASAWDEVLDLVALTVDIPRETIEAEPGGWAFEDVLAVTEVIFDVCILRSDGKGALPLLLGLVGKMTEVAVRTLGPALAKKRADDFVKGDTSKAKSGNGLD